MTQYLTVPKIDKLPSGLVEPIFDFFVNGRGHAVRIALQALKDLDYEVNVGTRAKFSDVGSCLVVRIWWP